jgi:hypothetical protein
MRCASTAKGAGARFVARPVCPLARPPHSPTPLQIARLTPGRTGQQCRYRYRHLRRLDDGTVRKRHKSRHRRAYLLSHTPDPHAPSLSLSLSPADDTDDTASSALTAPKAAPSATANPASNDEASNPSSLLDSAVALQQLACCALHLPLARPVSAPLDKACLLPAESLFSPPSL